VNRSFAGKERSDAKDHFPHRWFHPPISPAQNDAIDPQQQRLIRLAALSPGVGLPATQARSQKPLIEFRANQFQRIENRTTRLSILLFCVFAEAFIGALRG
jgi:hypothetical protein